MNEAAVKLLTACHQGGIFAYFWTKHSDGKKQSIWYPIGKIPKIPQGWGDVYFPPHPTDQRGRSPLRSTVKDKRAVMLINCLFADFDGKAYKGGKDEALQAACIFDYLPSVLVDSGGGFHAYWLLDQTFYIKTDDDRKRAIALQANWVEFVRADPGTKDLAHVLRPPGTYNHKYDPPRLVQVLPEFQDYKYRYSIDELEAASKPVAPPAEMCPKGHKSEPLPDQVDFWLDKYLTEARPGNRNVTGALLARQLRDTCKLTQQEAVQLPYPEKVYQGDHPYTRSEWEATVKSIYQRPPGEEAKGKSLMTSSHSPPPPMGDPPMPEDPPDELLDQPPEEAPPPTGFTVAELLDMEFPPQNWIIPDVITEGLTILGGRPKVGKSWMALQISHSVGTGGRIFDRKIEGGSVLFLAYEDSKRRLQKRIISQGIPRDALIRFEPEFPKLHEGGLDALFALYEAEQYRLIVIDTLNRAISGVSEREREKTIDDIFDSMQTFAMRRGAAVLLLDHTRKPMATYSDPIDDIIGQTSKAATADAIMAIYRKQGQRASQLMGRGREIEEVDWQIYFDPTTTAWQLEGETADLALTGRRREILDALEALGQADNASIAKMIGQDRSNTYKRLQDMASAGLIIRGKDDKNNIYYELP